MTTVPPASPRAGRSDLRLLVLARTLRGFGAGALSIVIAVDLASAGYSPLAVGVLIGLALAGGSLGSLLVPRLERLWSRRTVLWIESALVILGGIVLWLAISDPFLLVMVLLLGGIVTGGSDVSPLGAIEQAIVADATKSSSRTAAYAYYNLAGYVGAAFGALAVGAITVGLSGLASVNASHDAVFPFYAILGLSLIPIYGALSRAEAGHRVVEPRPILSPESRRNVLDLAGLFTIDAFGGGLIMNSLLAYYLTIRFAPSVGDLGLLFFGASLAAAASFLLAVPLARRIGLIRTMVFTHIPSSLLVIAFAFSPAFVVASGLWIARSTLSQMDVPTRQAYTQAIVPPTDRTAAAGITTAARSAQAFGAPVTGGFLAAGGPWLTGPFVLAGSVKIAYDLWVYRRFRAVRPLEERGGELGESGPRADR